VNELQDPAVVAVDDRLTGTEGASGCWSGLLRRLG
jgi:hypothetical protein